MSYANGYDNGFKKGYDDGYIRQTRSSVGGWGIGEIARACASPEAYIDTFSKGYSEGYETGLTLFKQEESLRKLKKEEK